MKVTGMIELVLIVAALVMGLPLFIMCNTMARFGEGTVYMNDKSTWDIAMDINYEMQNGVLVPTSIAEPLTISPAQAAALSYKQDEYTPNTARRIDFNYNATRLDDTDIDDVIDSTIHNTDPRWNGLEEFSFESAPNSRVAYETGHNTHSKISPKSKTNDLFGGKYYFVYNYARKSWMVTTKYINIFFGA